MPVHFRFCVMDWSVSLIFFRTFESVVVAYQP
jgi:hypothetical protein